MIRDRPYCIPLRKRALNPTQLRDAADAVCASVGFSRSRGRAHGGGRVDRLGDRDANLASTADVEAVAILRLLEELDEQRDQSRGINLIPPWAHHDSHGGLSIKRVNGNSAIAKIAERNRDSSRGEGKL